MRVSPSKVIARAKAQREEIWPLNYKWANEASAQGIGRRWKGHFHDEKKQNKTASVRVRKWETREEEWGSKIEFQS